MQISQSALFCLCCASFLAGILLSLFYDALYMMRLWSIPSDCRYTVTKINALRASRTKKKTKGKRHLHRVSLFFGDILFCLVGALTLILLLYWLNNGAFRAAAPLCMALGFWLWHVSISKAARIAFQWLTFGIETAIRTLLIPIKCLTRWMAKIACKVIQKQRIKCRRKQRRTYTRKELEQIDRAVQRLLPLYNVSKTRMQKGASRAKASSKKAV